MWEDRDEVTLKTNAYRVCQDFLEGHWKELSLQDFKFSVVSGGLSSRLYYCALPKAKFTEDRTGCEPNEVLLRVYGPLQEDPNEIVRQTAIFMMLSERNLGPKLYGMFPSGRLEQYIPSRSLKPADVRRMSTAIAQEMAKIHHLKVPIEKNPTELWLYMENSLEYMETHVNDTGMKPSLRKVILSQIFRKEIAWLNCQIQKIKSPVVFCHNDLTGGNILLKDEVLNINDGNLMLIDFELSSYNYRGFDIANHFSEWCFEYMTKDYPFYTMNLQAYPTEEEQLEYIGAYLDQMKREGAFSGDSSVMEAEKKKILNEMPVFRLAADLFWTVLSFKLTMTSTVKFPFLEYGEIRLDVYKNHKEQFLSTGFRNIDIHEKNEDY